jgi:hypothetical protein
MVRPIDSAYSTTNSSLAHVEANEHIVKHEQARAFDGTSFQCGEEKTNGHGRQARFIEHLVVISNGCFLWPCDFCEKLRVTHPFRIPSKISVFFRDERYPDARIKIMEQLRRTRCQLDRCVFERSIESSNSLFYPTSASNHSMSGLLSKTPWNFLNSVCSLWLVKKRVLIGNCLRSTRTPSQTRKRRPRQAPQPPTLAGVSFAL